MEKKLERWVKSGINGVIVQKEEIMEMIHSKFPELNIIASVACDIRSKQDIIKYKMHGATQVVATSGINTFHQAKNFKERCEEVGIKSEVFLHANLCPRGLFKNQQEKCPFVRIFKPEIERLTYIASYSDSENNTIMKHMGYPDQSGHCFRWCTLSNDERTAILKRHNVPNDKIERINIHALEKNRYFAIRGKELEKYVKLGFDSLKISGREYETKFAINLVRAYRFLINAITNDEDDWQCDVFNSYLEKVNNISFSLAKDNLY